MCTRTTFNNCCFAVILAILISVDVASGTDEPPVILKSTLKQKSLCPGDRSVTFTCTTRCTRVHWRFNGQDLVFFSSTEVGELKLANNHYATLLRCSEDSDGVGRCISVLNIVNPSPSGMTRVECFNGTRSTIVGMDYYRRVADPPSKPDIMNFHSQPLDQFDISWTWTNHNDSQLSYFEVQLDDTPAVRTQTSSIILSSNATGTNHTLELVAVDMCGQRSSVATKVISTQVIATSAVTTTSSSTTSTSSSISSISSSQPSTSTVEALMSRGHNFSGMYNVILIGLLVHSVIGVLANLRATHIISLCA